MSRNDLIELQKILDLCNSECPRNILFVAEYQQRGSGQFFLFEYLLHLILAVSKPHFVIGINNPDQPISFLEEVLPVSSERSLYSDIPNVEVYASELECLDVESQRWRDTVDILSFQFLHDGCLAGVVQAEDQYPHLALLLFVLLDEAVESHFEIRPIMIVSLDELVIRATNRTPHQTE